MAPVTIGVPVFNGAAQLDESLGCLARQTFREFKVHILDNASTDATSDIGRAWAERDARFSYSRQNNHVPLMYNFRDVVLSAKSPWFMWRAHDDLTADNYLEALYRCATGSPGCKLAVSTSIKCDLDGGRREITPPPDLQAFTSLKKQLRMLLDYPDGWFYGLWDTDAARTLCEWVCSNYPFTNAAEHLMLYGLVMDGAVRGTPETEIYKRIRRTAGVEIPKKTFRSWQLATQRAAFARNLRHVRSERPSLALRAAHWLFEPLYLRRRLPSLSKIMRLRVRELLAGPSNEPVPPTNW